MMKKGMMPLVAHMASGFGGTLASLMPPEAVEADTWERLDKVEASFGLHRQKLEALRYAVKRLLLADEASFRQRRFRFDALTLTLTVPS